MDDQYGLADLRQYINGKPFFPAISPPPSFPAHHRGFDSPHNMLVFTPSDGSNLGGGAASVPAAGGDLTDFEMEPRGLIGGGGGGDGCTARWPRQETLTLLEIRSRLDSKFKEANHKGHLWDELSRIMSEEFGYQRSGKKCREKFENLYKYYKKTKGGKAGRQDGKHYRFFRQLEALCGETCNSSSISKTHFNGRNFQFSFSNNNIPLAHNQEFSHISVPNSSDYATTSSDCSVGGDADDARIEKIRGKKSLKAKIRDSIDSKMRKLMEVQDAWMQKIMATIEQNEIERMLREEEWRKQNAARIDGEHNIWASERAWIQTRDIALMDALQKLTRKEPRGDVMWPESEVTRLIQLRNAMDTKFGQDGISEAALWDEIAAEMACHGQERSGFMCREKWVSVSNYLMKCSKKRRENSTVYQNYDESFSDQGVAGIDHNGDSMINDSCFRYFMGGLWEIMSGS